MSFEALILEDDQGLRDLTEDMLESRTDTDIEIDTAESVDQADRLDYPLVVTDYSCIDTEQVYDNAEKIIVYSGRSEDNVDLPENAEYVRKPGYDELVEEVDRYFEEIRV
ncbi:MAG: hypothetical protein MUP63_02780 [Candidatus Nanohaloarchaeota archaeon QJJ-7]|nr:hypothetical protein [Candidatus Nanohaloarchaeota archaeon QJJ-7]